MYIYIYIIYIYIYSLCYFRLFLVSFFLDIPPSIPLCLCFSVPFSLSLSLPLSQHIKRQDNSLISSVTVLTKSMDLIVSNDLYLLQMLTTKEDACNGVFGTRRKLQKFANVKGQKCLKSKRAL